MKKLLLLLTLATLAFGQNVNVQKTGSDGTNNITADLAFGTGRKLTFRSGSTIDVLSGTTINWPGAFIPWSAVSKTGSSLADLETRSAGDLSSGTLLAARLPAFSGDVSSSAGSNTLTLASVVTAGSAGSSTAIPTVTYDAKGRITGTSTNAVVAPAGTLTGSTLAANVTGSSLTSVGTIATGTWNGTPLGVIYGGTGVTASTLGGIVYGSGTNTRTELAGNTSTSKRFLSQTGTGTVSAAPAWSAISASDIDLVGSNGFVARTAASTYAARTITGTSGQITVTNGDGVSGNPTISLPSTITQATTFSANTNFGANVYATGKIAAGGATGQSTLEVKAQTDDRFGGLFLTSTDNNSASIYRLTSGALNFRNGGVDWFSLSSAGAAAFGGSLGVTGDINSGGSVSRITNSSGAFQIYKDSTPTNGARFAFNVGTTNGIGLDVYNGATWLRGLSITPTGDAIVHSTTASTSTTTGSATFGGGIGVAGAGYFGGQLNSSHSSSGSANSAFTNTNAGGYGLLSRGGATAASTQYVARFADYNNTASLTVYSDRADFAGPISTTSGSAGWGVSIDTPAATASRIRFVQSGQADWRIGMAASSSTFAIADNVTNRFTIAATTGDSAFSSTTEATTAGAGSLTTAGGIYAAKKIVANTGLNVGGSTSTTVTGIRSATATLDPPNIPAGSGHTLSITVTGATVGSSVIVNCTDGGGYAPQVEFRAYVATPGTVYVDFLNRTMGDYDPPSGNFRVTVIGF